MRYLKSLIVFFLGFSNPDDHKLAENLLDIFTKYDRLFWSSGMLMHRKGPMVCFEIYDKGEKIKRNSDWMGSMKKYFSQENFELYPKTEEYLNNCIKNSEKNMEDNEYLITDPIYDDIYNIYIQDKKLPSNSVLMFNEKEFLDLKNLLEKESFLLTILSGRAIEFRAKRTYHILSEVKLQEWWRQTLPKRDHFYMEACPFSTEKCDLPKNIDCYIDNKKT